MDSYKISIIMPVYNTPVECFSVAVNSILNQKYDNYELIIVDDGSRKEYSELYDVFAEKDSRIRLIHKENGGVSSARNIGTKMSEGDYVMYVDSDDILSTEAIAEGVDVIQRTGAQFVFAGIQRIWSYNDFVDCKRADENDAVRLFKFSEIDVVRDAFLGQSNPIFKNLNGIAEVNRGPYARLLLANIAKSVLFDETLVIGEDVEWNMRVLNACSTVCLVRNSWYGYLIYESSSLRKYYGNRDELLLRYLNTLYNNNKDFCKNNVRSFALNLSIAFYAYVQYELLSDSCPLSRREKEDKVAGLLMQFPCSLLKKKEIVKMLPLLHQIFLFFCCFKKGVMFLQIWDHLQLK